MPKIFGFSRVQRRAASAPLLSPRVRSVLATPPTSARSSKRAAHAQPRVLLGAMVIALCMGVWWAAAQNSARSSAAVSKNSGSQRAHRIIGPDDLARIVREAGYARRFKTKSTTSGAASTRSAVSTRSSVSTLNNTGPAITTKGFTLTEVDLTSNSPSDEREPAYSPSGDLIAFASTGADSDSDGHIDALSASGHFHIWLMSANGSQQRQITGLGADSGRDQRRPAWSPDGSQLVFTDSNGTTTELALVKAPAVGTTPGASVQITNSGGTKEGPSWSPSGAQIAFASNVDPNTGIALGHYNLFSIAVAGDTNGFTTITAGAFDDLNPAYSQTNPNVLYFSSNRTNNSANTSRRIWKINVGGGTATQVSDPTNRKGTDGTSTGTATDEDDFPSPSLQIGSYSGGTPASFSERVAFQSNSRIDATDTTQDLNIWSLVDYNAPNVTPTATPVQPPATLLVGSYTGGTVENFNPTTGVRRNTFTSGLTHPEDVIYGPDLTGDGVREIFVANRDFVGPDGAYGAVNIYDGATYQIITGIGGKIPGGGLTHPTGLIATKNYLYVSSGYTTDAGVKSANNVYRFRLGSISNSDFGTLAPSGNFNGTAGTAQFTFGNSGITNGIEEIAFGPTVRHNPSDNGGFDSYDLYVTDVVNGRIDVFDGRNGGFIEAIVDAKNDAADADGLSIPTGMVFSKADGTPYRVGPDNNSDASYAGNIYLLVASSGTDKVIRYQFVGYGVLPTPTPVTVGAGTPTPTPVPIALASVMTGTDFITGLDAPERIAFNNNKQLFVSNFGGQLGNSGNDDVVGLYDAQTGATVNSTFINDYHLNGAAGLGYDPGLNVGPAPTATPNYTAYEGENSSNSALLETSKLSSPTGANTSNVDGATEDTVADREPSFERATTINSTSQVAIIAFASQRIKANYPSSDGSSTPPTLNPSGGATGTHDIWTTRAIDFTPPELVPQPAGNQLFAPFVAPGPQAPYSAPRTAEAGLAAGGPVTIAVVLREQESGLGAVSVDIRNADSYRYSSIRQELVNDKINVTVADELAAGDSSNVNVPLTRWDDGPASAGGHERQANAIKGDGLYYCVATTTTPAKAGDYYIDLSVNDNAGNGFFYDNIWGFSTRTFQRASTTSTLMVSDYGAGQLFVTNFVSDVRNSDGNLLPTESYLLSHPGGRVVDPNTGQPGVSTASSDSDTFNNASVSPGGIDLWRVQCRGSVPLATMLNYQPDSQQQFDPALFRDRTTVSADPSQVPPTRKVAVSSTAIVWSSPYTGDLVVGPGTLLDPTTQANLTTYLSHGGRLLVTGRDVLFSLSASNTSNTFVRDELQASFNGESLSNVAAAAAGAFVNYGSFTGSLNFGASPTNDEIELAPHVEIPGAVYTYGDADRNQIFPGTDLIGPGSDTTTTTPAYTMAGSPVGQRVVRDRGSGLESRVVLLTFGMEGVNRHYILDSKFGTPIALNQREAVASGILTYFRTGSITGTVRNSQTTAPIPNFYVQVTFGNNKYIVRTNDQGVYEVRGLSLSGSVLHVNGANQARGSVSYSTLYSVQPASDASGLQINTGYKKNAGAAYGIFFGSQTTGADLSMSPIDPGTLRGYAVDVNKQAINNLPVLIKSIGNVPTSGNGGQYVALVRTHIQDAKGGFFEFTNLPPTLASEGLLTKYQVIFNPTMADIPSSSGLQSTYTNSGGALVDYARRLIPDTGRPEDITAPSGQPFVLDDVSAGDTSTDQGKPIVIPYRLRDVTGVVTAQTTSSGSTPVNGATVQLLNSSSAVVQTKTTASDGSYTFTSVPFGNYTIKASKDLGAPRNPTSPGLPATATTSTFTVAMGASATITAPSILLQARDLQGHVSFNGSPQNGAIVKLLVGAQVVDTVTTTTVSGVNGTYTFSKVPAGSYTVRASYTTSGDTSTQDGTVTVTLTTSTGTPYPGPDIALFRRTISGTVYRRLVTRNTPNPTPSPVPNATVTAKQGSTTVAQATSGTNGAYKISNLSNNTYQVSAKISNGATAGPVSVVVSNANPTPTQDFTITVGSVYGTVKLQEAGGTPTNFQGATVTLKQGTTVVGTTTSSSNGSFDLNGFAPGTYTVSATGKGVTVSATVTIAASGTAPAQTLTIVEGPITGTVQAHYGNTTKVQSGATVTLKQGSTVVGTTTTGTNGKFTFANKAPGSYTVTATITAGSGTASGSGTATVSSTGTSSPVTITITSQGITGTVTLNGATQSGANVVLLNSGGTQIDSATSDSGGGFTFAPLAAGTYTVKATLNSRQGTVKVTLASDGSVKTVTVELSTSTVPVQYPAGTASNPKVYLISIPYADSTDASSTTTVRQALSVPPKDSDGTENYQIFKYDPLASSTGGAYVQLTGASQVTRGAGYLIKVYRKGVSILSPTDDSTRKALPDTVTQFSVLLRRAASAKKGDNGLNLIGFPFNPATFSQIKYLSCTVKYNGKTYSMQSAISEQIISSDAMTLADGSNTDTVHTTTLLPRKGYFVNAYKDNVQLNLIVTRQ